MQELSSKLPDAVESGRRHSQHLSRQVWQHGAATASSMGHLAGPDPNLAYSAPTTSPSRRRVPLPSKRTPILTRCQDSLPARGSEVPCPQYTSTTERWLAENRHMPRHSLIPASFLNARSRSHEQTSHGAPANLGSTPASEEKLTCDVQLVSTPTTTNGSSAPAQLEVTLGERVVPITVLHEGPPVLVSLGNAVYEVVQDGSDSYRVVGTAQTFRVTSGRARAAANVTATDALYAPMPGRIVKVLCRAGDEVTPGAPLVVLEAMKMENELVAPRGGSVAEIFVREGDTVEARARLVKLTEA